MRTQAITETLTLVLVANVPILFGLALTGALKLFAILFVCAM